MTTTTIEMTIKAPNVKPISALGTGLWVLAVSSLSVIAIILLMLLSSPVYSLITLAAEWLRKEGPELFMNLVAYFGISTTANDALILLKLAACLVLSVGSLSGLSGILVNYALRESFNPRRLIGLALLIGIVYFGSLYYLPGYADAILATTNLDLGIPKQAVALGLGLLYLFVIAPLLLVALVIFIFIQCSGRNEN